MTETTRQTDLTAARTELAKARETYEAAKYGTRARRMTAEQVEFWGNKVAALTCVKL